MIIITKQPPNVAWRYCDFCNYNKKAIIELTDRHGQKEYFCKDCLKIFISKAVEG